MPIIIPCFTCFGDQNPVRDAIASTLQEKVGELFSLLWDWSLGWPTDLILLGRNAELLAREMAELKEVRDDTKRRVESEEAQPSMERKRQVEGWLDRVCRLEAQVRDFQAALDRQSVFVAGFCLGRAAVENLKRVRELKTQLGSFDAVVGAAAPDTGTVEEEMEELRILREDLMRRVEIKEAADPQMKRTPPVKAWLETVAALDAEAADFLRRCAGVGGDPPGSGEVAEKLRKIRKLMTQGKSFDGVEVVTRVLPDPVEEVHSKPVSAIVGGEETLSKIRGHLRDGGIAIIGIWGLGGVGKTTLLKQINNELRAAGIHGAVFDVVIWVTVSKSLNILAVQKDISERLELPLPEDAGGQRDRSLLIKDRARILFRVLCRKRFLLLLDDVWEWLDLELVGVPAPSSDNGCKIVLTTRSEEVCIDMDAEATVKVDLLDEAHSWELFRRTVRADAVLDDPSIRPLAEKVVAQCGGLPLALVTVGRAMANRKLPPEWRAAVRALQDNAQEIRGMKARVLEALKFSFDWLRSDTLRCCLLYCSLFPEDDEIDREQLVGYWIGEGFVDGADDAGDDDAMDRARGRGHGLITDLQAACLLESGIIDETNKVMLHDAVRDMALWLTSGSVEGYADRFLVHAGRGPESLLPATGRWAEAKRISFMRNSNLDFPGNIPDCPRTITLLMKDSSFTKGIPDALYTSLPVLCVLDLSQTYIDQLPACVGFLVHLRYLNISYTSISSLPEEVGRLENLCQLDMTSTGSLQMIPLGALSTLSKLRALNMYFSNYSWSWERSELGEGEQQRGLCLKDLESMEGLCELGLKLTTFACFEGLLRSRRLSRSAKLLSLQRVNGLTPSTLQVALAGMERLEELMLLRCDQLKELHFRGGGQLPRLASLRLSFLPLTKVVVADGGAALQCLQQLLLVGCHSLRHITWAGRLPCLKSIEVSACNRMEVLFAGFGEVEGRGFPRLRTMDLQVLPLLRSIASRPLELPSLEVLRVNGCPQLKKLPLGASSGRRMRLIRGKQEWWDGLEWEDETVKAKFAPQFIAGGPEDWGLGG